MSDFESTVEIGAPPETVWDALVAPDGHRRWYYDLAPRGEFRSGARISWVQRDGKEAEESTVREVVPPRRLVLDTRFLFAPVYAAQPPHTMTYDVEPAVGGSRVTLRVDFREPGPTRTLFLSEGQGLLKGLRVELDPAAQAEIRRLDQIGDVEIHDVTPDRVGDYLAFFDEDAFRDYPAWSACYCMETMFWGDEAENAARTAGDNRRDMSRLIEEGKVTGLLAYADGKPVGWCNYGPTTRLAGVVRKLQLEPADHDGVGSIACFVIASQYRGHGLARRLLDAACERLGARGLEWVEAYPFKAGGSAQANFRGPLEMYREAGFESYRDTERTLLMRKRLG